jgi:hypothetical protein
MRSPCCAGPIRGPAAASSARPGRTGPGELHDIIRDAEPSVKTAIYEQLGLQVTCLPGQGKLRADVTISPEIFAGQREKNGVMGRRVRGAS